MKPLEARCWTTLLSILLMTASCARGGGPSPSRTPATVIPPTPLPAVRTPTPSPAPTASAPTAEIDFNVPLDSAAFPLDLVAIDAENLDRLKPFKELTAVDLPTSISAASLAFFPANEYELVAHLGDGQLIVWNMVTGASTYRDWHASDDSYSGQHPALAISPTYETYLATSESIFAETGPKTASGTVLRPPDESEPPLLLPGASIQRGLSDSGVRVTSVAFSPNGDVLAASLTDGKAGWVQIWNIQGRGASKLVQEVDFDEAVSDMQFTLDGAALVCATGESLVYLHMTDGTEMQRQAVGFPIRGVVIGASGKSEAFWGDRSAVLQSIALQAGFVVQAEVGIRRVDFLPDESLAVVADGDRLRFWELSSQLERMSFRGPSPFLDARVLYNGRVIATIDEQSRVLLWGVTGGYALPPARARISAANVTSLEHAASLYIPGGYETVFSPNSDWLAFGSAEGIYLVDLPSLQLRRLLPQTNVWSTVFDVSANGRRLAWVADEGVVNVWDIDQDSLAEQITVPDEGCCAQLLLNPEGNELVTVSDSAARVWFLPTGREIYSREHSGHVEISPDGSELAFDEGLDVAIFDLQTMQDIRLLTGFTTAAPVVTTKFAPDWGVMYWVGRVGMQFVDVRSGTLGIDVPFSWGEYSPRGDRIAAVENGWTMASAGQVHVIDIHTGETLAVLDHHEDAIVQAVAFSPDGRLLATALGETVKIWDADSGEELTTLPRAAGVVHGLSFSPDGRILLTRVEGAVTELWVVPGEALSGSGAISGSTASSVARLESLQLEEPATDAVYSPDGSTIAVSAASGAIWYWDLARDQAIEGVPSHTDWIYRLAYSPDGTRLTSVSKDGYFRQRYGPRSYGSGIHEHVGELSALAYLPDGKSVVTGGQDGMLRFRELPLEGTTLAIPAHVAWLWGVAVSPAGDLLATASADRTIKLWRLELDADGHYSASEVRTLTGHTATVWGVAFSPDGRTLASASWDGTVRLWDPSSGAPLAVLEGHTDWVYDVAFSPDGSVLASSSADGTIRLWNLATGEPLATLTGPGGGIRSVEFSPDGRTLVSASDGGEVTMWGVAP